MKYISTRGQAPALSFEDVLLTGLASDGGLYVPEFLPRFSASDIKAMRGLPYTDLALRIIQPFVADAVDHDTLKNMVDETYGEFNHAAVAPLVQLDHNNYVMELFHGPTLAFKDFALQLLGRLLGHILKRRNEHGVVLGATSGDTGSAAIEGCRHCDNVDIYIMHPHQRVSDVQRRQMTTLISDNIHNLAIEGNFDDCQAMVKASFADQSFLDGYPANGLKTRLIAVNSINWARIMAQIVYYFHAALTLGAPARPVSFSVPTGNFGDIFAGYIAKGMGLPIDRLIVATNQNDILHRFFAANDYRKETLHHSLSPSMDIMVSSNFERLLFDLHGRDGAALAEVMQHFETNGELKLDDANWQQALELFDSTRADDETICATISQVWQDSGYLADPHTAAGIYAAKKCGAKLTSPVVTLATAHPVKFPQAIVKADLKAPDLPPHLADLHQRDEKYTVLDNDLQAVQNYLTNRS
ncbi:threonine synthase [Spongorhabdus nitratireducens]